MSSVKTTELPAEVRKQIEKQLGIPSRRHAFTKQHVRRHAIEVLNVIKALSQDQRKRVLTHALKLNEV